MRDRLSEQYSAIAVACKYSIVGRKKIEKRGEVGASLKVEESLSQVKFNTLHREYCIQKKMNCPNCGLRLYCCLAPCERTDEIMAFVVEFLLSELNPEVDYRDLPEYYNTIKTICPLNMKFKGAVGYEKVFKGNRP